MAIEHRFLMERHCRFELAVMRPQRSGLALLLCLVGLSAAPVSGTQVVVVPVADMYSAPSEKSDIVSQAISRQ